MIVLECNGAEVPLTLSDMDRHLMADINHL